MYEFPPRDLPRVSNRSDFGGRLRRGRGPPSSRGTGRTSGASSCGPPASATSPTCPPPWPPASPLSVLRADVVCGFPFRYPLLCVIPTFPPFPIATRPHAPGVSPPAKATLATPSTITPDARTHGWAGIPWVLVAAPGLDNLTIAKHQTRSKHPQNIWPEWPIPRGDRLTGA